MHTVQNRLLDIFTLGFYATLLVCVFAASSSVLKELVERPRPILYGPDGSEHIAIDVYAQPGNTVFTFALNALLRSEASGWKGAPTDRATLEAGIDSVYVQQRLNASGPIYDENVAVDWTATSALGERRARAGKPQDTSAFLVARREIDRMVLHADGWMDFSRCWDWNTKSIFVALSVRYSTAQGSGHPSSSRCSFNEVVILDAIVRKTPKDTTHADLPSPDPNFFQDQGNQAILRDVVGLIQGAASNNSPSSGDGEGPYERFLGALRRIKLSSRQIGVIKAFVALRLSEQPNPLRWSERIDLYLFELLQAQYDTVLHYTQHDHPSIFIDHFNKRVFLNSSIKYYLDDFGKNQLFTAESNHGEKGMQLVLEYQVMSYSGWAPLHKIVMDDAFVRVEGKSRDNVKRQIEDNVSDRELHDNENNGDITNGKIKRYPWGNNKH